MRKKKNNEGVIKNTFKTIAYSTGFVWAKASRAKNIVDNKRWKKNLSGIKGLLTTGVDNTTTFYKNITGSVAEAAKSFRAGYDSFKKESFFEAEKTQGNTLKRKKHKIKKTIKAKKKKTISAKKKKKVTSGVKVDTRSSLGEVELPKDSQEIEDFFRESTNGDFEKEIEAITRGVPEV